MKSESSYFPQDKKEQPLSDAERQGNRDQRIIDAGLRQRKVVAHPDDFPLVRAYARKRYEARGVEFGGGARRLVECGCEKNSKCDWCGDTRFITAKVKKIKELSKD